MKQSIQKKFGPNLKRCRKQNSLTQEQLAKFCGLSTITIKQYESGKRQPRYETIQMLADVLGIPVVQFFAEEE